MPLGSGANQARLDDYLRGLAAGSGVTSETMSWLYKKAARQLMTGPFMRALSRGLDEAEFPKLDVARVILGPDGVPTIGPSAERITGTDLDLRRIEDSFPVLADLGWGFFGRVADTLASEHATGTKRPDVTRELLLRSLRGNFGVAFGTAAVRFANAVGDPDLVEELLSAARRGFKAGLPGVAPDRSGRPADPLDGIVLERAPELRFGRDMQKAGCCYQYKVLGGDLQDACGACPIAAAKRAVDAARGHGLAGENSLGARGLIAG